MALNLLTSFAESVVIGNTRRMGVFVCVCVCVQISRRNLILENELSKDTSTAGKQRLILGKKFYFCR